MLYEDSNAFPHLRENLWDTLYPKGESNLEIPTWMVKAGVAGAAGLVLFLSVANAVAEKSGAFTDLRTVKVDNLNELSNMTEQGFYVQTNYTGFDILNLFYQVPSLSNLTIGYANGTVEDLGQVVSHAVTDDGVFFVEANISMLENTPPEMPYFAEHTLKFKDGKTGEEKEFGADELGFNRLPRPMYLAVRGNEILISSQAFGTHTYDIESFQKTGELNITKLFPKFTFRSENNKVFVPLDFNEEYVFGLVSTMDNRSTYASKIVPALMNRTTEELKELESIENTNFPLVNSRTAWWHPFEVIKYGGSLEDVLAEDKLLIPEKHTNETGEDQYKIGVYDFDGNKLEEIADALDFAQTEDFIAYLAGTEPNGYVNLTLRDLRDGLEANLTEELSLYGELNPEIRVNDLDDKYEIFVSFDSAQKDNDTREIFFSHVYKTKSNEDKKTDESVGPSEPDYDPKRLNSPKSSNPTLLDYLTSPVTISVTSLGAASVLAGIATKRRRRKHIIAKRRKN